MNIVELVEKIHQLMDQETLQPSLSGMTAMYVEHNPAESLSTVQKSKREKVLTQTYQRCDTALEYHHSIIIIQSVFQLHKLRYGIVVTLSSICT